MIDPVVTMRPGSNGKTFQDHQLHDRAEGCGRGRASRILWLRKGARENQVSRPPARNPEFLHEFKGINGWSHSFIKRITNVRNSIPKKNTETMVHKSVPPRVAGLHDSLPPLLSTGARRRRFYGEERGTGEADYQGALSCEQIPVVRFRGLGSDNIVW